VDLALEAYFDSCFFAGKEAWVGRQTLYGWLWTHQLGRGRALLPRARDALRGWLCSSPGGSQLPAPWEAVLAGAVWLARDPRAGSLHAARAGVVCFHCHLRPSEALALRAADVVHCRPRSATRAALGVVIAPSDGPAGLLPLRTSKTGAQDDTVLVADLPRLTEPGRLARSALLGVAAMLAPGDALSPLTHSQLASAWRRAWQALGLAGLRLSPHSWRPGGAAHDALYQLRDLLVIQRRGRWRAAQSVRRYEKAGILLKQIAKLPCHITDTHTATVQVAYTLLA
jgi:integrase